jgi:arabinofuranosyltransferase
LLSGRTALLGAMLLYLLHSLAYGAFQVDDAYISFTYARNFAAGNGLTFNGIVVEGYSNFSWTLLIAAAIRLGLAPLFAARILSVLSGLVIIFLTYRIALRLLPSSMAWVAPLPPLMLSVLTPFAVWTMAGLETIWFTLLVTLAVHLSINPQTQDSKSSALVTLMCALTRPEGILVLGILAFHSYSTHFNTSAQRRRRFIIWLAVVLLLYAVYICWRFSTYGYLLPNTAYLKLDTNWTILSLAIRWIADFFVLRPIFSLAILLGVSLLVTKRHQISPSWWLILGVIFGFVVFVLTAGRDWMPHHRFLVPILPVLAIVAVVPLATELRPTSAWARPVLLSLTLAASLIEVSFSHLHYSEPTQTLGQWTDHLIQTGYWINANTEEDEIIAVVDAGAISYYGQRTTIDILGLNDVHIAHSRHKSDPYYVLSYHPILIQLHIYPSNTGEGCTATDSVAGAELYTLADFRSNYHNAVPDGPMCQDLFLRVNGATDP